MAVPDSKSDDALLRNLVPLNTLSDQQLGKLLSRIKVEKAKKGTYLFREGDTDHQNVYLISGTVALLSGEKEIDLVTSGTPTARFALAHQLPRKHSARAKSTVNYVRIDSRMLSGLLARSQHASYEVNEDAEPGKSDWMGLLLQSPVFQQIPPANLQRVMMRMEEISVCADDVIVQQGDEGDYFYLISQGLCRVSRQPAPDRPPVELAQLKAGQGFGEESLISGKPRSSSVTMLTDGILVRLSRGDFAELVQEHLAQTVSYEEACRIVEDGGLWLDVRPPEEYEQGHLPGALNLPFFSLRFQASSLASDRIYVLYGDEIGQSATGAYLLMERGHETYVIGQDWNQIAIEAGLRGNDASNKSDNVVEFNREANASAAEKAKTSRVQEEEARQLIEELRNRLVETEQAYREQLEQKEQVAKSLRNTLGETTHQLEVQERKAKSAQAELEKQIGQLRLDLAETRRQLEEGKAVSKRETQLRKDINRLEENMALLTRERAEVEKTAREAQEARSRLESQLKTAQAEHEVSLTTLNNELSELREQMEEAAVSHQRLELQAGEESGSLRTELSELQARVQTLDSEREQLSAEKERIQAQLTEVRSQMESGSEEASLSISWLESELQKERQTAEFLRRSLATAESAVEISEKSVEDSESENQGLHGQLAEQQAEVDRLKAIAEDYQAQIQELRAGLEASEQARLELISANEGNSQALEQEKAQILARIEQEKTEQAEQEARQRQDFQRLEAEKAELIRELTETKALLQEQEQNLTHIEQAKAEQAEYEARQRQEFERLEAEKAELARELSEAQALLQEQAQALGTEDAKQQSVIEQLERSLAETKAELEQRGEVEQKAQHTAQALQQARNQIAELEQTVTGLREVQLEMESRVSDDLTEELEELRGRLEEEEKKRQEYEQLAGKAEFLRREREVQETAVDMLTDDLEQLSKENERLALERDGFAAQLTELRTQFSELLDENNNLHSEMSDFKEQTSDIHQVDDLLLQIDELRDQADEHERERETSRIESDRMKKEIRELRSVIETYVEQIQDVRSFSASEETAALRSELNMIRRQATEDLEAMRLRLVAAEERAKQVNGREVGEAAALQAMRQEMDSIHVALSDKEQMLSMSQAQCRTLEDAIEDRDKEIDQLRRKLELLLSKTGGLDVPTEELNAMGFKFNTVAAFAESSQMTEMGPDDDSTRKRSKLGRLFRKD